MKNRTIEIKTITTDDKNIQYKLLYGKTSKGLKEIAGEAIAVANHALYDVITEMDDGEIKTSHCLAIMSDQGNVFVTTSPTAIFDFTGIVEFFGDNPTIKIVAKKSAKNKEFITIDIAD